MNKTKLNNIEQASEAKQINKGVGKGSSLFIVGGGRVTNKVSKMLENSCLSNGSQ